MTDPTRDPWLTDRSWQIVRADLGLAHVFMPLSSFKFQPAAAGDGYTIVHTDQPPQPDCFGGTLLRPAGSSRPTFEQVAQCKTLPVYDTSSASVYADVSAKADMFMDQDPEVQRLEGVIRVPTHAHGAQPADSVPADQSPLWSSKPIHVYQFSNVVGGDGPLLLFRVPLSPQSRTNGDGTAVALAK
jgi:hypothetical protein